MKKTILLLMTVLTISCASEDEKISKIIGNSYYGILGVKKMKDIQKLKEDVYSLAVHPSKLEKYFPAKPKSEYKITRYIYKTYDGAYRIYFIIDMTEKRVVDKSSDPNEFFIPIATEILGENMAKNGGLEGNNLVELMRY